MFGKLLQFSIRLYTLSHPYRNNNHANRYHGLLVLTLSFILSSEQFPPDPELFLCIKWLSKIITKIHIAANINCRFQIISGCLTTVD